MTLTVGSLQAILAKMPKDAEIAIDDDNGYYFSVENVVIEKVVRTTYGDGIKPGGAPDYYNVSVVGAENDPKAMLAIVLKTPRVY